MTTIETAGITSQSGTKIAAPSVVAASDGTKAVSTTAAMQNTATDRDRRSLAFTAYPLYPTACVEARIVCPRGTSAGGVLGVSSTV